MGNLHVVKANDGIIIRNPLACFKETLGCTDCQDVSSCHNTGCGQAGIHQLICQVNTAVVIDLAFKDVFASERNLKFTERLLVTQQAFFHDTVFLHLACKESHMFMSVFQHIAGCQIAAVGIVDTDIVVIMVVAVAVN